MEHWQSLLGMALFTLFFVGLTVEHDIRHYRAVRGRARPVIVAKWITYLLFLGVLALGGIQILTVFAYLGLLLISYIFQCIMHERAPEAVEALRPRRKLP